MKKPFTCAAILLCLLIMQNVTAKEAIGYGDVTSNKQVANHLANNNNALSFIENKGQITDQYGKLRKDIDYKLDAGGMLMFIGDEQIHYQWTHVDNSKVKNQKSKTEDQISNVQLQPSGIESYRLDVTLLGANKNAIAIAEDPNTYYENYYLPQCPNGITAHSYGKVTYKNVYPNIDWVVYVVKGSAPRLKYDFIIHPGGNPADIKIQYNGATSLQLKDGALIAETPMGSITENMPYSYYADSKQEINSSFKLSENILSYNIPQSSIANNQSQIIIDPVLNWGTYFYSNTFSGLVAADKDSNAYLAGHTYFTTIATSGTYANALSGSMDVYLAKFDISGQPLWATYYGGTGFEYSGAITCDADNNVYVTGSTSSTTGLATANLHQRSYGGGDEDAMLAKFSTNGQLLWSTYYGGAYKDIGLSISCDNHYNVYLGGASGSLDQIASSGSYQQSKIGTIDAFLAKFDSSGRCLWGTYFGGGLESNTVVATDTNEHVYLAGGTQSTTNVSTPGSHQPSKIGSHSNGYLAQFDSSGSLQWATYYGGYYTGITAMGCNIAGDVYVAGSTTSLTNISTPGAYKTTPTSGGTGYDCFLAKFNSSGARQWGTYFGGEGNELISAIGINDHNREYIVGYTYSSTGIATANADVLSLQGYNDAFIAEFNSSGGLNNATYYGGEGHDANQGYIYCAVRPGILFLSGNTNSTTGIATPGGFQSSFPYDASTVTICSSFLAQFFTDTLVYIREPFTDTLFCPGDSIHVRYGASYKFNSGNVFSLQLSDASGSFSSPVTIAMRTDSVGDTLRGRIPVTALPGNHYRIRVVSTDPALTSKYQYYPIHIKAAPVNLTVGSNSPVCISDTLNVYGNSTTTTGISWSWSGPSGFSSTAQTNKRSSTLAMAGRYILTATLTSSGCSLRDTEFIIIKPRPGVVIATGNSPVCYDDTITLAAACPGCTIPVLYSWAGPTGFNSSSRDTIRTHVILADSGAYILTVNMDGCLDRDTAMLAIHPQVPTPYASNNGTICVGSKLQLTADSIAGATYQWSGPSFNSTLQNPDISNTQDSNKGDYIVIATKDGCISFPDTTHVHVAQGPFLHVFATPADSVCESDNLTLNILALNAGGAPKYQWILNGNAIPGATNSTYNTTGTNGDVYSMILTPGVGIACVTPVNADSVTIKVVPYQVPLLGMTASDSNAWPGLLVNFAALDTNAGSNPTYRWTLNGQLVAGAQLNLWSSNTLNDGDTVCVEVISSNYCSNPRSLTACHTVKIATGVHNVSNAFNTVHIYPNPATGQLTVEGLTTGTRIQLSDVYGRSVYDDIATSEKLTINTTNLVTGNYILQLTDANGARSSYKVVKE